MDFLLDSNVYIIVIVAFFAEYIDSTLGMGYGTILSPVLIAFGYSPLEVVPSILMSEFVTGIIAGFTHHMAGNVDFRPKTMNIVKIYNGIREFGIIESYRIGIPDHLKIVSLLVLCSLIGPMLALKVISFVSITQLKIIIAIIIIIVGVVILITMNRTYPFSWFKIVLLGIISSFNKVISGGGYGPIVSGGQLLAGVDSKNAVAITSLAEGMTCLVGVTLYIINSDVNFSLAPYLLGGAVLSAPLSAYTVRKINTANFRRWIGLITLLLGLFAIYKIL